MQQEALGGPRQAAMYVVQLIKKETIPAAEVCWSRTVAVEAVRGDGGVTGLGGCQESGTF